MIDLNTSQKIWFVRAFCRKWADICRKIRFEGEKISDADADLGCVLLHYLEPFVVNVEFKMEQYYVIDIINITIYPDKSASLVGGHHSVNHTPWKIKVDDVRNSDPENMANIIVDVAGIMCS